MTNWNQVRDETTTHLQNLIRLETVNPPGNEAIACEYVARVLDQSGIASTILESRPGRGNIVARLKGNGQAAPLLLMAHLDVVPAEAKAWTHPPFGGVIADDYMYGRGTLDTKGLAAMEVEIMLLLKREDVTRKRDVVLMLNADEEAGGNLGAGWMVSQHADMIQSEFAINEGGGFGIEVQNRRFYAVQTGEKGTARFTMRAHGRPGHGSQPHSDNAVLKLASALRTLGEYKFPKHISNTARLFIEQISRDMPTRQRESFRALLDSDNKEDLITRLPVPESLRSMIHAMTHNTATPTVLTAGSKVNVIPSTAQAEVDARIIPGITLDEWERELRQVIPPQIEIEFQPSRMGIESTPESPLFDTMRHVIHEYDSGAECVPFLSVGATDARHVTKNGTLVYGFCPMRGVAAEFERVHGHDERVSIDNIEFGTRVLYQVVSDFITQ